MSKKEAEVLKETIKKLDQMQFHNQIIWYRRLHNGLFYARNGTPIRMGSKKSLEDGMDLDIVILFQKDDGNLATLFVDTKREGVKKFDYEQKVFSDSLSNVRNVYTEIIDNANDLRKIINEIKKK